MDAYKSYILTTSSLMFYRPVSNKWHVSFNVRCCHPLMGIYWLLQPIRQMYGNGQHHSAVLVEVELEFVSAVQSLPFFDMSKRLKSRTKCFSLFHSYLNLLHSPIHSIKPIMLLWTKPDVASTAYLSNSLSLSPWARWSTSFTQGKLFVFDTHMIVYCGG